MTKIVIKGITEDKVVDGSSVKVGDWFLIRAEDKTIFLHRRLLDSERCRKDSDLMYCYNDYNMEAFHLIKSQEVIIINKMEMNYYL